MCLDRARYTILARPWWLETLFQFHLLLALGDRTRSRAREEGELERGEEGEERDRVEGSEGAREGEQLERVP